MKKFVIAGVLLLIAGLAVFTLLPKQQPAPAFALADLNGNQVDNSHLNGKVTLINFWFPSCPGCVSEMPKLIKMANDYQGKNFQILGIAVPVDPPESVRNYVAERRLPFTVMYDTDKQAVAAFVKTELYPTSVLIGKNGEIVKTFVGEPDFNLLYQQVDGELAK